MGGGGGARVGGDARGGGARRRGVRREACATRWRARQRHDVTEEELAAIEGKVVAVSED